MSKKPEEFEWVDRLPEFGQSVTINSLIDTIEVSRRNADEWSARGERARGELDRIIQSFWTPDEISVAKEGNYA